MSAPSRARRGRKGDRLAVLSCIHGNLAALEAVLADVERQRVGEVMVLGDLVGYGPQPNEVITLLREREVKSILGCWDDGVGKKRGHCGCKFISEEEGALGERAFTWTDAEVTSEHKDYLAELPFAVRLETERGVVLLVHGSPRDTGEYLMHSTHDLVLLERAAAGECDMLICGHTHVPFVRRVGGRLSVSAHTSLAQTLFDGLRDDTPVRHVELSPKIIVNAGSVGEPRHGGLEATYVIVDLKTFAVEIRRVPYDFERTAEVMRRREVPPEIVARFLTGAELVAKAKEVACAC